MASRSVNVSFLFEFLNSITVSFCTATARIFSDTSLQRTHRRQQHNNTLTLYTKRLKLNRLNGTNTFAEPVCLKKNKKKWFTSMFLK